MQILCMFLSVGAPRYAITEMAEMDYVIFAYDGVVCVRIYRNIQVNRGFHLFLLLAAVELSSQAFRRTNSRDFEYPDLLEWVRSRVTFSCNLH